MHPEHKLLKFIVMPVLLVLLSYFVWNWIETPGRWSSLYSYNSLIYFNGKYDGSTELTDENLGKSIVATHNNRELKGAFAACDGKKSVWYCSSGDPKIKLTGDSKFRVASISKVFTSLAVLQLEDSGKLSLEDKVEKYIKFEKHFPTHTNLGLLMTLPIWKENFWPEKISRNYLKYFNVRKVPLKHG